MRGLRRTGFTWVRACAVAATSQQPGQLRDTLRPVTAAGAAAMRTDLGEPSSTSAVIQNVQMADSCEMSENIQSLLDQKLFWEMCCKPVRRFADILEDYYK